MYVYDLYICCKCNKHYMIVLYIFFTLRSEKFCFSVANIYKLNFSVWKMVLMVLNLLKTTSDDENKSSKPNTRKDQLMIYHGKFLILL